MYCGHMVGQSCSGNCVTSFQIAFTCNVPKLSLTHVLNGRPNTAQVGQAGLHEVTLYSELFTTAPMLYNVI
jgi:hypothetical protein